MGDEFVLSRLPLLHAGLRSSVRIRLLYSSIGVLSESSAIREQDVLLAGSVLDRFDAVALYSLNSAIREDRLFLAIGEDALDRAVRESTI